MKALKLTFEINWLLDAAQLRTRTIPGIAHLLKYVMNFKFKFEFKKNVADFRSCLVHFEGGGRPGHALNHDMEKSAKAHFKWQKM